MRGLITIIWLLATFAPPALQAAPGDVEQVKQYLNQSIKLQLKQEHEQALITLDKAFQLMPHPKILFYKGKSLFALKRYQETLDLYQSIKGDTKVIKYSAMINETMAVCKEMLKQTLVTIKTVGCIGATVTIDNKTAGFTPLKVKMNRGVHQIKVTLKGYEDFNTEITCQGEDSMFFSYTLTKVTAPTTEDLNQKNNLDKKSDPDKNTVLSPVKKTSPIPARIVLGTGAAMFITGALLTGRYIYDLGRVPEPVYDDQGVMVKTGGHVVKTNLYIGVPLMVAGVGLGLWSYFLFKQAGTPGGDPPKTTTRPLFYFTGCGAGMSLTW